MFLIKKSLVPDIKTDFPITQAVVEGIQMGKIYSYQNNYFIAHHCGFCSLIHNSDCLEDLIVLFQQNEMHKYFHIYNATEDLIDKVQQYSRLFNFRIRKRIRLEYRDQEGPSSFGIEGYYIQRIQESNFSLLSSFNLDLERRFWNNKLDCINNSYGVVVLNENHEPVGICYAAAISGKKAEIDVFTKENCRGKGIAKFAVASFINKCIKNDITAYWDCFEENISSYNTALSLNFKCIRTYFLLSIFRNEI
jgi:GNAT acetyltransferase